MADVDSVPSSCAATCDGDHDGRRNIPSLRVMGRPDALLDEHQNLLAADGTGTVGDEDVSTRRSSAIRHQLVGVAR
jgi:hypothetical protein